MSAFGVVNDALLLPGECRLPRLNHDVSLIETLTQGSQCNGLSVLIQNVFVEYDVVEQWLSEMRREVATYFPFRKSVYS